MFSSLWKIVARLSSVINPSEADATHAWSDASRAIVASSAMFTISLLLVFLFGYALIKIASIKSKRPVGRQFKILVIVLGVLNLIVLNFGAFPAVGLYHRLYQTAVSGPPSLSMKGEVVKTQAYRGSRRSSVAVRYVIQVKIPGRSDDVVKYSSTYDSFTSARSTKIAELQCFPDYSCWLKNDFIEIKGFCKAMVACIILNFLFSLAFLYLIKEWRKEFRDLYNLNNPSLPS